MNMDTSSDTSMTIMMVPWLHFTGGDSLFFDTWQPSSKGAIAGACIGLALLAFFERWVNAMRSKAETYWGKRALSLMSDNTPEPSCHATTESTEPKTSGSVELKVDELPSQGGALRQRRTRRTLPPFIPSHDIPRGILFAFQALLSYALMLAVMTFQAAFIISIVVGSGIGEVLFGRVGGAKSHLLH